MNKRPLTTQDRQAECLGMFRQAAKKVIAATEKKRPVDLAHGVDDLRAAVLQALEWGL